MGLEKERFDFVFMVLNIFFTSSYYGVGWGWIEKDPDFLRFYEILDVLEALLFSPTNELLKFLDFDRDLFIKELFYSKFLVLVGLSI